MEMTPWVPSEEDLRIVKGSVTFASYEKYKQSAEEIAQYINDIELTEDNMKEVKTILANARRVCDSLDTQRKDIRKAILEEYTVFESQIKELTAIVGEADNKLRSKLRQLEERERADKEEILHTIWLKRIGMYDFKDYVTDGFKRWLTPKHLNKSQSISASEKDMVTWMEKTESDIHSLLILGTEYVAEYLKTMDTAKAIENVTLRNNQERSVAEIAKQSEEAPEPTALFLVRGKQNIALVQLMLENNDINFERKY